MADFRLLDRTRTGDGQAFSMVEDGTAYTFRRRKRAVTFDSVIHPLDERRTLALEEQIGGGSESAFSVQRGKKFSAAVQEGRSSPIFFDRNEIIIGFYKSSAEMRAIFCRQYKLLLCKFDYIGNFGIFKITSGELATLLDDIKDDDRVLYAEPNVRDGIEDELFQLDDAEGAISPTKVRSPSWAQDLIDQAQYGVASDGVGVTVAIVDGLFERSHPAIASRIVGDFDLRFSDNLEARAHGLAVAGVISGGVISPGTLPIGVAPSVSILPVSINTVGTASYPERAMAIGYLADVALKKRAVAKDSARSIEVSRLIVNCSWQLRTQVDLTSIRRAFELLNLRGAICVCSAGNDNVSDEHFPSDYRGNISVGGVGPSGGRSSFSNWGQRIDIAAPAGDGDPIDDSDLLLAFGKGEYVYNWGTSFAAPYVSGVIASLWSRLPTATATEIASLAKDSIWKPFSTITEDRPVGAGIVSLKRVSEISSKIKRGE